MKNNVGENIKSNMQSILSIVIVNWNNKNLLEDCLTSIYNTQNYNNYEIIIVDNNSNDDSVNLIKKKFSQVKLIENDKNLGFAKANNQAIKAAKGKYVLLLNNDTIIMQKYCFDKMLKFMEENREVGILGCTLLFPNRNVQSMGEKFPSIWEIFKNQILFLKTWRRLKKINNQENVNFKKVDWISGACMMAEKKLFEEIGFLKEDFFMYGEDVEFCYRAHKRGWQTGVLTDTMITHLHSKSTDNNLSEMLYYSIINDLKNIEMLHKNNIQKILVRNIYLIGLLIRSILAIFRNNKKSIDYLKCFKRIFSYKGSK